MSRQWQIRPYIPHPRLINVQVGSILFISGHDGMERLRCNFAGTFCDWECYLHPAGYSHPVVVIELHRHDPEIDDHRMLPVTFIQMTSSPQSHFITFPVQWFKNAEGKKSTLLLPHTYTLPLHRFKPFFDDASSISIKRPDPPLCKGLWLHCDVTSKNWIQLNTIMQAIRDGNAIFQISSYPSKKVGTEIVAKLRNRSQSKYSCVSDVCDQGREQNNNARTVKALGRTTDSKTSVRPENAFATAASSSFQPMQKQQIRKQTRNSHPQQRTVPGTSKAKIREPPSKIFTTPNLFDLLGNNDEEDTAPSIALEDPNDTYLDGLTEKDLYEDSDEEE